MIDNWIEFSKNEVIDECDCPIECELTKYLYSYSIADYPTLQYSNYLMQSELIRSKYPNNITYEELRKRVAKVTIFYDDLRKTIVSESIKTEISDLISNLGGTLGLFLGLSFLSLVEFVELILQAILIFLNDYKLSNRIKINV